MQALDAGIKSLNPTETKLIRHLYPRESGGARVRTKEVAERMGFTADKVS